MSEMHSSICSQLTVWCQQGEELNLGLTLNCRKLPIDLPGQALHAFQLGLDHPITRERMLFEAPLPAVMEKLLLVIRKRVGLVR